MSITKYKIYFLQQSYEYLHLFDTKSVFFFLILLTVCVLCCVLQDQAAYGGTPLAMLAAQCNKINSKSPPPLAEATVGKSFVPWKKSPTGGVTTAAGPTSGFHLTSSARVTGSLTSPLTMQSNGLSAAYNRSPGGTPTGNPSANVYGGGSEHFLYPASTTTPSQVDNLSQVCFFPFSI